MLITLNCLDGKSLTIDTEENDSVLEFKNKIYKLTAIPPERQRLIYCGRSINNDHGLSYYNLQNKTSMHLVQVEEIKYWSDVFEKKTEVIQTELSNLQTKNTDLENKIVELDNVIVKLKKEQVGVKDIEQPELVEKLTLENNQLLTINLKLKHGLEESKETNTELIKKIANQNSDSVNKYKKMINEYQEQNNKLIKDKQVLLEQVDKCTDKINKFIMEKQDLINQTNQAMKQQEKILDEKQELLQAINVKVRPMVIRRKTKFPRFIGRNQSSMP